MADSYFCLEIGESFIKLADAKKNGNIVDVQSLGYIDTDPAFYTTDIEKNIENQATAIGKLVNSFKITKKNVNIVIPDATTYSQILPMPRLNEKELISAIKYQADQFIPMPIDETNIDIEILKEDEAEKKILVLMVAAPKKLIEKIQNTVELSGLIPDSIENETTSIGRFLSELGKIIESQATEGAMIINLNRHSTSFYFFDSNLLFFRENHNFNLGYDLFLKEIQINTSSDIKRSAEILKSYDPKQKSSYDLSTIIAPALREYVAEIKRFITQVAQKHHSQIKYIYLVNEIFRFPALSFLIEQSLQLPIKELNPYPLCKTSPLIEAHKDELSLFISAIGGNLR